MAKEYDDLSLPEDFDSTVRLFPLTNVVLFPAVVQGLHIFEPRYREMLAHCMETDRLITMARIDPDQPLRSDGEPTVDSAVCVGRVLSSTTLEDGSTNLLLVGVKRATIITELKTSYPYRLAHVEIFEERSSDEDELGPERDLLLGKFKALAELIPGATQMMIDQFSQEDLPLGRLVDMICYSSGMEPAAQ